MDKNISAKFSIPSAESIYCRPRLLRQMPENSDSINATWIWGPAGSGKTSLANSFVKEYPKTSIWFRVQTDDEDLQTFICNIFQVVNKAPPAPNPFIQYKKVIADFFLKMDKQATHTQIWVWDNCENLPDECMQLQVLGELLDLPLQRVRMVFTSRNPPSACFRPAQTSKRMNVIDWHQLRLTADESQQIARLLKPDLVESEQAAIWHQQSDGWAIALVLLLQSAEKASDTRLPISYASDELFEYLTDEVLTRLDDKPRQFLSLMSILPFINKDIAYELSADTQVGFYLEHLDTRLHLIECSAAHSPLYRLHPLLKDFLFAELGKNKTQGELNGLIIMAAKALQKNKFNEDACDLYLAASDWDSLCSVALVLAEQLSTEGRLKTLAHWLNALPESYSQRDNWLAYWVASSNRFTEYPAALAQLETVFNRFKLEGDIKGQYMTWLAIVESISLAFDDLTPLKHWISEYDKLKLRHSRCPGIELRLKVFALAAGIMSMVQPTHPRLQRLIRICQLGGPLIPFKEPRAAIIAYLAFHYVSSGQISQLDALSKHLEPALSDPALANPIRLLSHAMTGLHQLVTGKVAPHKILDAGMALASRGEIFFSAVHAYRIYCDAIDLNIDAARNALDDFFNNIPPGQRMEVSHHDFMSAWLSALQGDNKQAIEKSRLAKNLAITLGFDFGVALNLNLCAQLYVMLGDFEAAESELKELALLAESNNSKLMQVMHGFSRAWFKLKQSGAASALPEIEQTFLAAQSEGILAYPGFLHTVMGELVLTAFDHGVDSPFMESMVRRWKLTPYTPLLNKPNWPWVIRIRTLGVFSVEIEGQAIDQDSRANQRIIDFIQVLIAFGGTAVPKNKICYALWPNSEGDKASHALENLLHRARKLLGANVLMMSAGRISLSTSHFWVDIWALKAFNMEQIESIDDSISRSLQLTATYQGEFLEGVDESWVLPVREQLRRHFLNQVHLNTAHLVSQNKTDAVIDMLLLTIDREPYHEPLYFQLAQCYFEQGRHSEACHIYQQCQKILSSTFDIPLGQDFQLLMQKWKV